ncbi:heme NO-binding domain-containing protein [Aquimonas voraii]|uniref:Haem-NO-binding n=1 Tax=Aquimonas voraii TaxID=265719 RepID=A0A1G6U963_9GAMM|nr:heme NO-binding domain-containing protein [Aquimonas voraii]SDD37246.1 Haem-NO-binding [Aquimonas voraii]
MLGMVFTELMDMVETRYSPELADRVLQRAALPHGGAYTAVGYYPHEEIVRLVGLLSEETGQPVDTLVRGFGQHLLGRFEQAYPELFAGKRTLYDFLASIESHIHVEVHKLYPEARLPRFEVLERGPRHLQLAYRSPRRMSALAEGLIIGAADLYKEPQRLELREAPELGADAMVFELHALY